MVEKPLHSTLRLSAGTPVNLRSGDLVSVEVLNRLKGGKWAVELRGRVVPAASDLQLVPGQRLRALVSLHRGQIVLRLQEHGGRDLDDLLRRARLPLDPAVRQIVESFVRTGLGVKSELVQQARRLLDKLRLEPRRFARLVALAVEKGIDLGSAGLEELLPTLGYGEGRDQRRQYRGRQMPDDTSGQEQELKEAFSDLGGRDPEAGLPVFNHLRGRDGTWIVVPFRYSYGSGAELTGTLRLLYDEPRKTSTRLVLIVKKEQDGGSESRDDADRWSFLLDSDPDRERGYTLRVYCSNSRIGATAEKHLRQLRLKLQNLGVETDDTIRIDDGFDGFSPSEDAPAFGGVDLER